MNILRLLPVLLSCLLLGAHFLRGGHTIMMMICLAFPLFLLVRRPWVPMLMQLGMFLGSLVWIQTLFVQVSVRQASGMPVKRYAAIMAGVTLFTGVSALVFMLPTLRKRYSGRNPAAPTRP